MPSVVQKINARLAQIAIGAGSKQAGFFIQYPHAGSVLKEVPTYLEVEAHFDGCQSEISALVSRFAHTFPDLQRAIEDGTIPWEPEGMFPPLDVVATYHMVREYRPRRIVEIGSGASSYVLARALADNQHGELTCIDPEPRRSIEKCGARTERRILSYDDTELVQSFAPNDMLFIDSSHIMLPGMDVDIQFNRMFPRLPIGSIVHVHDIFLPEGYPSHWSHRGYSEQNSLIGWILSGFFAVIYPSFYAATRLERELRDVLGSLMPGEPKENGGSIWLQRRA